MDWVDIPAGIVHRGTPEEEISRLVYDHHDLGVPLGWFLKECPREVLSVPAFRLTRTPVTVGDWNRDARAAGVPAVPDHPGADHPVQVLWDHAAAYCAWLATVTALPTRLPTEREWERAARGDDAREYPWGDAFAADKANLAEAGIGATTPVGSFPAGASPFGVLDMAGNADEWTSDLYAPYPGAPAGVPDAEIWAADQHVTRGGSFSHHRDLARCARRHGVYPPHRHAAFRIAASA